MRLVPRLAEFKFRNQRSEVAFPIRTPNQQTTSSEVVRNSVQHPEIAQHDVQALLWAIIARAKFEDLQTEMKATASRLLTPRQLAALNRSALDVLSGNALTDALGGVPEPLRQIAQAEAQLRQMLTTPGASFAEMERVAVSFGGRSAWGGQPGRAVEPLVLASRRLLRPLSAFRLQFNAS